MGIAAIVEGVKPSLDKVTKASKKSLKLGVFLLSFASLLAVLLISAATSELTGGEEGSLFVNWVFSQATGFMILVLLILPVLFLFKRGVELFVKEENGLAATLSDFLFGPCMFVLGAGFISMATLLSEAVHAGGANGFDNLVFINVFTLISAAFTVLGLGALLYGLCLFVGGVYKLAPFFRSICNKLQNWIKRIVKWDFHIDVYRYACHRNLTLFQAYLEVYYEEPGVSFFRLLKRQFSRST